MPIIKCDECSKDFYKKPSRIKSSKNNFCSQKCQGEYKSKNNSQIRICIICKKDFKVINGNIKRRMSLCCSRECLKKWWIKNRKTSIGADGYEHYNNKRKHRVIIERFIKRKLTKDEVVHHVNGVRSDNRIENLKIMTKSEHHKLHSKDKKLKKYAPCNRKSNSICSN